MAIHPLAIVDPEAQVHPTASIGPFSYVKGKVVIEANVDLRNHVTVYGRSTIGEGTIVMPHAVVGGDPQDLKFRGEDSEVVIGKRCRIHEFVTINKGTASGGMRTVIGDDCLIMTSAHIAHDCQLAERVVISNNAQLAGHITVGRKAIISGMVGVHHFVTIGELAFVGAMSGIRTDVPPFTIAEGHPAEVRNVNVVGLRRDGFADADIRAIKDAFRELFHDRTADERVEALARVRASAAAGSPVHRLCDWVVQQRETSIKGRLQEAHRTPLPMTPGKAAGEADANAARAAVRA
ncbi:MAG: acyl-ACP--UDP-N-acetylglucosamine O-acyltransferase [Planctomycetes bacterium]|nr:acyl-ACP--UDP-N-acetylglucosamine O-acyltransferase [Planctomycetota bacterium]